MRVAALLLTARWRPTVAELIDAVYYDHPDGGPDDAHGAVVQFIHRFRLGLECLGITLESGYGAIGYGINISESWAEKVIAYRPRPNIENGGEYAAVA
jgi:hypothetical protein